MKQLVYKVLEKKPFEQHCYHIHDNFCAVQFGAVGH